MNLIAERRSAGGTFAITPPESTTAYCARRSRDNRPVTLHVANGHHTTDLIDASGVPGRTMVWCDPLNDGPVPGNVTDSELVRARAAFLAGSPEEIDAVAADLQGWRDAVDGQQHYDELVLWFEHDLFDQLNVIQLLSHLATRQQARPVTMVSIDAFPGHENFRGLGELQAADLPPLFERRQPVTAEQLALAERAWTAYRSADPRAIESLLATDTSALPYLAAALQRHLEEFPSDTNGLSRSEQRLMQLALEKPADIHATFPRMHEGERWYFITDLSFFDLANALATAKPALLTINLEHPKDNEMPFGSFTLTKEGREVALGNADRIKVSGIDRWLGGVHLEGRGPMWRWSAGDGKLIEA